MSFILDALKKSENERQRQAGPSLADVQVRRRASEKPWWAVAVGALLVVNLGVLLIVLIRSGDAEPAVISQAANPPQAATDAVPAGGNQVPLPASASSMPRGNPPVAAALNPAVRSLALEAEPDASALPPEANPELAGAAAAVPDGPPRVRPVDAPAVAPLASGTVFASVEAEQAEVLPTLSDVAARGTVLPDMHLDIHVYSRKPAERFVFVNMQKYVEGQPLKEGPVLERITSDGAVLNQRGLRFLLPRP